MAVAQEVQQYADLHAYGHSLGVDLDHEGEEDLRWAVEEAFNAPLPSSWTEYMDDAGRAYYVKEGSSQSTWEHPMDEVYRELFQLVKQVRGQSPEPTPSECTELVRGHLQQVHQRAKSELAGWSGPYSSEQGDYYYNEVLKASTWDCPVAAWETELRTRNAVLSRLLLAEPEARGAPDPQGAGQHRPEDLLQALRLQLGNLQRESLASEDVPFPSTTRSFHTARSVTSSRSGRSTHNSNRARLVPSTGEAPSPPGEYTSVD